jgi:hypothetical protein
MGRLFPNGEETVHCSYRFKTATIEKIFREPATEAMNKGKYFEYLCLGGGADKTDEVTDLPRTLKGGKTVDQERIESQVVMFQRLLDEFEIKLTDVQHKFSKEWDHPNNIWMDEYEILIEGTIDFIHDLHTFAMNQNGESVWMDLDGCVHDLKLTANIWETYTRGSWAYPWSMDHSQVAVYQYLTDAPFCYWVFDYKPKPEFRLWQHDASQIEMMEMHERIRKSVEKVIEYSEAGWPKLPAFYRCETCPVIDCDKRTTKPAFMIF